MTFFFALELERELVRRELRSPDDALINAAKRGILSGRKARQAFASRVDSVDRNPPWRGASRLP